MSNVKSILLVGVGGQGTILASKILSDGLLSAGYDVKMSEIHGMSQRGGSVSTQIRYGESVNAPTIGKGEADVIVAFEKMEALRWIEYLKPGGRMIINDYEIPSVPVLMGTAEYPKNILEELADKVHLEVLNAAKIATELGNPKVMNIVLLGATIKALMSGDATGLGDISWETIMKDNVKPAFYELNLKAFNTQY